MSHRNNNFSQQSIHRAKLTVKALLGATVLSGILTLSGVYLAISGYISEGVEISQVAMMSTVELTKQLKDANERLDQTIEDEAEINK
jgi:heme/copper-type cytochrome/quinol oxidase subunit 4